ncbi:hypothetical protein L218DRAFT_952044, partial [Marasmius fiardii PR-910]
VFKLSHVPMMVYNTTYGVIQPQRNFYNLSQRTQDRKPSTEVIVSTQEDGYSEGLLDSREININAHSQQISGQDQTEMGNRTCECRHCDDSKGLRKREWLSTSAEVAYMGIWNSPVCYTTFPSLLIRGGPDDLSIGSTHFDCFHSNSASQHLVPATRHRPSKTYPSRKFSPANSLMLTAFGEEDSSDSVTD